METIFRDGSHVKFPKVGRPSRKPLQHRAVAGAYGCLSMSTIGKRFVTIKAGLHKKKNLKKKKKFHISDI